jgi:predicted transglutaminase-like cysteine proteinase
MRMIFLLLSFLLPLLLNAESALHFKKEELREIQKEHGRSAKNRILDFSRTINALRLMNREEQLVRVNTFLNGYLPEYDAVVNKREDYWSTPKEFLITGYGDCEEYAITKYYTLRELGFDHEKLCLAVVKDRYTGSYHMVLLYFKAPSKSPLVLDNLSFRVLPLVERKDLVFQYCFNETTLYTLDERGNRVDRKRKEPKFERLIKRIGEGR